jgi:Complex1_LYR-like
MAAKQVYRALQRAIKSNVTKVSGNTTWQEYVRSRFRANIHGSDEATRIKELQLAKDYIFLVDNIAHHRDLLVKFNIGADPDERNKEMVEAVARRVGFRMPLSTA